MISEWILIIGMMLLTFGPRYLPFALAGKIKIPPLLHQALAYVPIAVLTAIIAQATLIRNDEILFSFSNHYLMAASCAFVAALLWKRLFLTVMIGLCVYVLVRVDIYSYITT